MSVEIHYEQAVYGSFPFWDRGYGILAQSPGCRPEWIAELRAVCQGYGERPAGAAEAGGLFAIRLASGPWMIASAAPTGTDDRGRPGALAFHALLVSPRDYERAGCDPFAFAGLLHRDWTAGISSLPAGVCRIEPARAGATDQDARVEAIVAALVQGRRVALETPGPIDELAHEVWLALPPRVSKRASVATWAFGNGNRFDLVALPRLGGAQLDPTYVIAEAVADEPERGAAREPAATGSYRDQPLSVLSRVRSGAHAGQPVMPSTVVAPLRAAKNADQRAVQEIGEPSHRGAETASRRVRLLPYLGMGAVLAGIWLGLTWRNDRKAAVPASAATSARIDDLPPDRSGYHAGPTDPDIQRRVHEGLVDLADRFGVLKPEDQLRDSEPAALMRLIAERLRYQGPRLSIEELSRLGSEPGGAQALAWDARIHLFTRDRPLPPDFDQGPPRWQLDVLVWSFHLEDDPRFARRSDAEVPHALVDALAVDEPLGRTSLSERYPALAAYVRFLETLPKR